MTKYSLELLAKYTITITYFLDANSVERKTFEDITTKVKNLLI